jgi:hypothetical protein
MPIVKHILGKWSFLQRDLLPLLIFHDRDKRLAFLTLMLLVQLTELPSDECDSKVKLELLSQLAMFKEAFLEPRVISTLMVHLADCLKVEAKQKKHNDMIELIFVIFKQLLSIPEGSRDCPIQKQLILKFKEESVLEAIIFLSQEFTEPFQKKLAMHFLEINFWIFNHFRASQIVDPSTSEKIALLKLDQIEKQRINQNRFVKSLRHSKFGTSLQIFRDDGSSKIVSNIYAKNIDMDDLGKS